MPKRQMIFEPKNRESKEEKHYECKRCANRGSPLCELCSSITSPGGRERKPKYYVEFTGVTPRFKNNELSKRGIECRRMLEEYIYLGEPLPVALVVEYNKLVEDSRDSK